MIRREKYKGERRSMMGTPVYWTERMVCAERERDGDGKTSDL